MFWALPRSLTTELHVGMLPHFCMRAQWHGTDPDALCSGGHPRRSAEYSETKSVMHISARHALNCLPTCSHDSWQQAAVAECRG